MLQCLLNKIRKEKLNSIMDFTTNLNDYIKNLIELNLTKTTSTPYLIQKIDPNTFVSFVALEKLHLGKNQIESISTHHFSSLFNLKELDLSENHLVKLESSTFQRLSNLKKLLLTQNQLEYIDIDAFVGLTSLEELFLDENALETIRWEMSLELINF